MSHEYEQGYRDAVADARHAFQHGYMGAWLASHSPAGVAERAVRATRQRRELDAKRLASEVADGTAFEGSDYDC